jgi:hypothetical protein
MPSSARSLGTTHLELADEGIRAPFRGFMNWPWSRTGRVVSDSTLPELPSIIR